MSGDIALPGEAVYSQYDDAIDRLDEDDDVETAVSFAEKSQKSREESVSSMIGFGVYLFEKSSSHLQKLGCLSMFYSAI